MANDLVAPQDLTGLPGFPFTDLEVDAAVVALRGILGWHVAPVKSTDCVLDFSCTRWRILPTRQLVSVDAVADAATAAPLPFWASKVTPSRLVLDGPAPEPGEVSVTMTHGYEECPPDLFGVIAVAAAAERGSQGGAQKSFTSGPFRIDIDTSVPVDSSFQSGATLDRYRIFEIGFS